MKKQWTTVSDFILHGKVSSKYTIIEVEGINQVGDGGALTLVRTGSVGHLINHLLIQVITPVLMIMVMYGQ